MITGWALDVAQIPQTELRASPLQIMQAKLLQLPVTQLAGEISAELARNPALREGRQSERGTQGRTAGYEPAEVDRVAADVPFWEQVLSDVAAHLPTAERPVAACVLADLDGRGWLGRTVPETARWLGVEVACVQRVLAAIRAVAGPAVAAEGLRDALLLRLAAEPAGAPPVLRALIGSHLEDIAAQNWGTIARALCVPEKDVLDAVEFLRRELRPGVFSCGGAMARPPVDVMIEPDQQETLRVSLTASPVPEVDPGYARLAREPAGLSETQAALVRAQVASARQFVEALHRRDRTLLRIVRLMVARQQRFVVDGPAHHQPLTRGDIAGQAELHASTVSRAIAGKTARLPDGRTIALAGFFGSAVGAREILAQLIGEVAPASDATLATLLAEQGVCVSRRTVAKYRAQLCRTGFRH